MQLTFEQQLIVSLVGGVVAAVLTAIINNVFAERRLKKQWQRERQERRAHIIIPRKIEHLEEIRAWLKQGFNLWRQVNELEADKATTAEEKRTRTESIKQSVNDWSARYQHERTVAYQYESTDANNSIEWEWGTGPFPSNLGFLVALIWLETASNLQRCLNYPDLSLTDKQKKTTCEPTAHRYMFFRQGIVHLLTI